MYSNKAMAGREWRIMVRARAMVRVRVKAIAQARTMTWVRARTMARCRGAGGRGAPRSFGIIQRHQPERTRGFPGDLSRFAPAECPLPVGAAVAGPGGLLRFRRGA